MSKTEQGLAGLLLDDVHTPRNYQQDLNRIVIQNGGTVAFNGDPELKQKILKGLEGHHLSDKDRTGFNALNRILLLDMTQKEAIGTPLDEKERISNEGFGIPYEIMRFTGPFPYQGRDPDFAIKEIVSVLEPGQEIPSLRREVEIFRIRKAAEMAEKLTGSGKNLYVKETRRMADNYDTIAEHYDSYRELIGKDTRVPERRAIQEITAGVWVSSKFRSNNRNKTWLQMPDELKSQFLNDTSAFTQEAGHVTQAFRDGGTPPLTGISP